MSLPGHNSIAETIDRIRQSLQATVENGMHKLTFRAMSTHCRVNFHDVPETTARELQHDILHWVGEFEARYSRFIPDSLVNRINAAAGSHWVEIDSQTDFILNQCQQVFRLTQGAFDPTVLPLVELWNWKADARAIPSDRAIAAARELAGWNQIQRRSGEIFLPRKGMCLDFGGIGKEYAVDCVLNMILHRQVQNALVDFGQDVRGFGHPPGKPHWLIGLEEAQQPGKC
jgi:thiamine biosynthesis lipoprotein